MQSYGEVTRELQILWKKCFGTCDQIPGYKLLSLFHAFGLFPSKSQIHEMLYCASDCSNRSTAHCITFGEFCVFATELKACYENQIPRPQPLSKIPDKMHTKTSMHTRHKSTSKYEVFLGGSCNPTSWRQDTAIPLLKSLGITYYNPQVSHWRPELIELENQAKQTAEILFFVIDNQTRSVASMIEAANISGCQQKLILVIREFQGPGQEILGEPISEMEYEDLMHGQAIVQDLVERQGIPVFSDIHMALQCTARMLREGISPQDLGLADHAQPVRMAHIQLGDKLIKLREAFDALDTSNSGVLGLTDVCLAFRILTNDDLSMEDLQCIIANQRHSLQNVKKEEDVVVDFDQFCCIVSEFKNKQTDGHRFLRSVILRTLDWFHSLTVNPFARIIEWILPRRRVRLLSGQRDVYLGGSCGPTKWREEIAIPILKKNGLTYFNPQVSRWSKRLIPIEAAAMENCRVLLFVITNTSRSVAAMAVAAHYVGLGCNAVLCIQYLSDNSTLGSDKLTKQAIKDYNRGRTYLSDLANREGIPVFECFEEAVQCVVQKCKNGV